MRPFVHRFRHRRLPSAHRRSRDPVGTGTCLPVPRRRAGRRLPNPRRHPGRGGAAPDLAIPGLFSCLRCVRDDGNRDPGVRTARADDAEGRQHRHAERGRARRQGRDHGHLQDLRRGPDHAAAPQPGGRRPGRSVGPWRRLPRGLRLCVRELRLLATRARAR